MFSERYGYRPESKIQYESVSDRLRRRIWNLFYQKEILAGGLKSNRIQQALNGEQTIEVKILDLLGYSISSVNKENTPQGMIESYLIKFSTWYEVYDFIEIHIQCISEEKRFQRSRQYNELLECEKSGYRIVDGVITPITDKNEIKIIEMATRTEYFNVNQHIQKALGMYADLENPDYENSIKESISAVEAMCCIITGMDGGSSALGKAIKKLKDNGVHIHSAMEKAFLSLYGYASDEDGIRHGGINFISAPSEDAKFMLVACSAFVNYLIEKMTND